MPAGGKGEGTCIVHASGEGVVWPAIGWLEVSTIAEPEKGGRDVVV